MEVLHDKLSVVHSLSFLFPPFPLSLVFCSSASAILAGCAVSRLVHRQACAVLLVAPDIISVDTCRGLWNNQMQSKQLRASITQALRSIWQSGLWEAACDEQAFMQLASQTSGE